MERGRGTGGRGDGSERARASACSRCSACALSAPDGKAAGQRDAVRAPVAAGAPLGRAAPRRPGSVPGFGPPGLAGGVSARLGWARRASASPGRAGAVLRDWGLRRRGGLREPAVLVAPLGSALCYLGRTDRELRGQGGVRGPDER